MQGPYKAAQVALSSTFCLCPTGDSKGFTARFYFSLLHGCLPIRVDGYRRNATIAAPTYPFPQLIDWSRLIIDMRPDKAPMLLPRLFAMSEREIEKRQSYLQHVAHWLLFDNEEHAHHDASAAVIHTIPWGCIKGLAYLAQASLMGFLFASMGCCLGWPVPRPSHSTSACVVKGDSP